MRTTGDYETPGPGQCEKDFLPKSAFCRQEVYSERKPPRTTRSAEYLIQSELVLKKTEVTGSEAALQLMQKS